MPETRDSEKVVISLSSIWGLFSFGAILIGSFTMGSVDTVPEVIAIILYGLTLLPACILAIWFRRTAAHWLIALSPITAFGLLFQVFSGGDHDQSKKTLLVEISELLLISAIPALIGWLLIREESSKPKS